MGVNICIFYFQVKVPNQIQNVLDTRVEESNFYHPFKFDQNIFEDCNESRW